VTGERPAWLSDEVARGYRSFPPRGEAREIKAAERSLFSGNLSFRSTALRGIGGFWPARGAGRLRDRCSEEHHAQRDLARNGWATRYEPALAAERIVDAEQAQLRSLAASTLATIGAHANPLLPARH
jgi:hypothetical protein